MKSIIKLIRHWIVDNLDLLVIIIGGIILSVRVFFPAKYYLIDYKTTLLQALGIAVITGVIFYAVKKLNKSKSDSNKANKAEKASGIKKDDSQLQVPVVSENEQWLDKSLPDRDREFQVKPDQMNISDICSLTGNFCEYYDLKENICFYGKEGIDFWKSKKCPKVKMFD